MAIITDLKARGIAFRSLTEQLDTTTPHGELLFSLFGALAQYERALTRERVMAGPAASVCRTFKVPHSTLLGSLARIGWPARLDKIIAPCSERSRHKKYERGLTDAERL